MTMPVSEKTFLEKLAGHVPGLAGYREREARRETDRRLREFLAGRVDEARGALNEMRNAATKRADMAGLEGLGVLDRVLQRAAASLRYADQGYSGVFDQVKIREAELDAIYAFDTALVAKVVAFADRLRASRADAAPPIGDLAKDAEALAVDVARRREILEKPGTV